CPWAGMYGCGRDCATKEAAFGGGGARGRRASPAGAAGFAAAGGGRLRRREAGLRPADNPLVRRAPAPLRGGDVRRLYAADSRPASSGAVIAAWKRARAAV